LIRSGLREDVADPEDPGAVAGVGQHRLERGQD
jgi:hypothetical protein